MKCPLCVLLALAGPISALRAEEAASVDLSRIDKSQYTLFNPTPSKYLRAMSTDRPDKTESPYTVDAGHLQIEMDLMTYSYDRARLGAFDTHVHTWSVAPINFKFGLCNQIDLQLGVAPWNVAKTDVKLFGTALSKKHREGFGDVVTRLKWNLWGNDGGQTAFATMPYLKIPTNQDKLGNDDVEGGIIFPLAAELAYGFGMGLMTVFAFNHDIADNGYHPEFVNSITFGRDIVGKLGVYMEFWSWVSSERNTEWIGTFDLGFTYGLTKNIQLDTGVNIGVTDSAPDLNPFLGLSWRF